MIRSFFALPPTGRLLFLVWLAQPGAAGAQPAEDVSEQCSTQFQEAQVALRDAKLVNSAKQARLCTREACPTVLQGECAKILAQLEDRTPRVSFLVRDADGKERADARVFVDGTLIVSEVGVRSIPLDPGERTVRAELPEGIAEQKVVLREGDRARVIELALPRPPSHFRMPAASWVLGSIGLASMTAGAIAGGFALSEYRDADETCGQSGGCSEEIRTSVTTKAIAADVTLGAGAAALVSAVIVALATGWSSEGPPRPVAVFGDHRSIGVSIAW